MTAIVEAPRLRIVLAEFFGVGGTADYTHCLAQSLAERGHAVLVVTSSLFEPVGRPAYDIARVFHYRSAEAKPWKAAKLGVALGPAHRAVARFNPHVVHAQGTVMPAMERLFYRSLRQPASVCTVHDVQGHERRPWLGSFTAFYRGFDALVCHSVASRERMRFLLPRAAVAVIPHGRYTPLVTTRPLRDEARATLRIDSGAHVALMFGFIRRYKGLGLFVDALEVAVQREPRILGLVAGRPLYDITDERNRAEASHVPIRWDLRYIDRDELGTFFAAADVVVLPYDDTSDSGAIELAAAFGVPVVTTSVGGLAEAFSRHGVGSVVPPHDATALAEAMTRRYASNGSVVATNSWDEVAARTEVLYTSLLSAGSDAYRRTSIA